MKTEEELYYFISKPSFVPIRRGEVKNFIVRFLYCDEVYMFVYLKKKKERYEVHYPTLGEEMSDKCGYSHFAFERERVSAKHLRPYFVYFKNANHAKAVEKEVKLAFRRWLKSEEK